MSDKIENSNELNRLNKTFRSFKIATILIDIFALILLFIQIKMGEVSYYSYVLLIICNLVVFLVKPKLIINMNNKK